MYDITIRVYRYYQNNFPSIEFTKLRKISFSSSIYNNTSTLKKKSNRSKRKFSPKKSTIFLRFPNITSFVRAITSRDRLVCVFQVLLCVYCYIISVLSSRCWVSLAEVQKRISWQNPARDGLAYCQLFDISPICDVSFSLLLLCRCFVILVSLKDFLIISH